MSPRVWLSWKASSHWRPHGAADLGPALPDDAAPAPPRQPPRHPRRLPALRAPTRPYAPDVQPSTMSPSVLGELAHRRPRDFAESSNGCCRRRLHCCQAHQQWFPAMGSSQCSIAFGARTGVIHSLRDSSSSEATGISDRRTFLGRRRPRRCASLGGPGDGPHDNHGHPVGGELSTVFNAGCISPQSRRTAGRSVYRHWRSASRPARTSSSAIQSRGTGGGPAPAATNTQGELPQTPIPSMPQHSTATATEQILPSLSAAKDQSGVEDGGRARSGPRAPPGADVAPPRSSLLHSSATSRVARRRRALRAQRNFLI